MARNDQNLATVRRVFDAVYPYNNQVLGCEEIKRLGTLPASLVRRGWARPVPAQTGSWVYNRYLIQFPPGFSIEEYLKEWKQTFLKSNKKTDWWENNRLLYRRGRESADNFYYLIRWDEAAEAWNIVDKCFAYAYQGACKAWKIDVRTAQSSIDRRVVHGSNLKDYKLAA